jgi:hypothetical protein
MMGKSDATGGMTGVGDLHAPDHQDARPHVAAPPMPPTSLDLLPSRYYHRCSRRFFLALLSGRAAPKEPVTISWRCKVDVYSIYRETRSSDSQGAARERHYAGWAADEDNARRRAEEIYEGRDSTEAVVVIGNGVRGVEVVYRMDGES